MNNSSLTINWQTPETIGDSGLDGYSIEYCKDGSKSGNASEHIHVLCVYVQYVRLRGCTCPRSVRGQIDSSLGPGRIRQAAFHRLSLYLLTPLLEVLVCSDDSMPSEISSWQSQCTPYGQVVCKRVSTGDKPLNVSH